jgi:hypothetical protein
MDAAALRELRAPFKIKCRDGPEAALVTLKAEGDHAWPPLNGGKVHPEGGLDFRDIRLTCALDIDEPQDRIEMLLKLTELTASCCNPCATHPRLRPRSKKRNRSSQ